MHRQNNVMIDRSSGKHDICDELRHEAHYLDRSWEPVENRFPVENVYQKRFTRVPWEPLVKRLSRPQWEPVDKPSLVPPWKLLTVSLDSHETHGHAVPSAPLGTRVETSFETHRETVPSAPLGSRETVPSAP